MSTASKPLPVAEQGEHSVDTHRSTPTGRSNSCGRFGLFSGAALGLLVGLSTPASAQTEFPVVDGRARVLAATGHWNGPLAPILDATVSENGFAASVRFANDDVERWIPDLEKSGVRVQFVDGQAQCIGAVCAVHVPWESLDAAAETPGLIRLEAAWRPLGRRPLINTVNEVGGVAAQVRRAVGGLTGFGVTIGDIDTAFDIFHPAFFNADGGFVDWIDADGDGRFDPARDALDVNADGVADPDETMTVLDGTRVWFDTTQIYRENDDDVYQAGVDWLYRDSNENNFRDFGAEEGFRESDPTYGEPMYTFDDVDGDGEVDLDEKFVALGSSSVSALVWGAQRYIRGSDLIYADTRLELRDEDNRRLETGHGTSVAGILGGGQANRSVFTGFAPDADLVSLVSRRDDGGDPQITVLRAGVDLGVDVMIHEYSTWNWIALDGGGNFEAAMDESRRDGMIHVNPAGNLGSSLKHTQLEVGATEVELLIDVPGRVGAEDDVVGAFMMTLHWNAEAAGSEPEFELVGPTGETFLLDGSATEGARWVENHVVVDTPDVSPRGTAMRFVYVGREDAANAMRSGIYRLRARATGAPFELHMFVDDFFTGWEPGVGVADPVTASTMCWPSTADSAFTVGAYGGFADHPWEEPGGTLRGELRRYSSRGPRIDGEIGMDIIAPDDPLAPVPAGEIEPGSYAWYGRFGGTSGAGPHVAGVLAQLRQFEPDLSVDALEQLVIDNVFVDFEAGPLPSPEYGYGKVRIHGALDPPLRPTNAPPTISAIAIDSNEVVIDVRGSSDPDGDPLQFSVDLDYDGTLNLAPAEPPFLRLDAPQGEWIAVVYAYDNQGGRSGAVVRGNVTDTAAEFDASWNPPETEADAGVDAAADGVSEVADGSGEADVPTLPVIPGGGGGGGCAVVRSGRSASSWAMLGGALAGLMLLAHRRDRSS